MRRHWKPLLLGSIVLAGLAACRSSRPAGPPDVVELLQRRQLKLGKSTYQRVVELLGEPTTQSKGVLSVRFRDRGSQTNRWVTLHYPQLGVECRIAEVRRQPRLCEVILKPPYAGAVFDSIRLSRQLLGKLAAAYQQPVHSSMQGRYLRPYEMQGWISVNNVSLEAHVQLDSATWNRCQRQPALSDSLVALAPLSRIVFKYRKW